MRISLKRIYDPATAADGYRVLVDRIWPRGVAKRDAALDDWMKELAPSKELRQWFGHDRSRWNEFVDTYHSELDKADPDLIAELRQRAADPRLTLLFAAKDIECNNAVALKRYLEDRR